MIVTLKDVAKASGVALITASRAVSGKGYVSEKKKQRILKKANQLGYQPNFLARSLVTRKTNTIGLIIPDIGHTFFTEISRGIEQVLNEKGYNLILCHSEERSQKEEQEIKTLTNRRVDGLIIAPSQDNGKDLKIYSELMNKGKGLVFIDRYFKNLEANYVLSDDFGGAYQAVKYLIQAGHRNIIHLSGPKGLSTAQDRLNGYKKALSDFGINFKPDLVAQAGTRDSGYTGMKKILDSGDLPTAVFAFNDSVAIGAWSAIEEKKLKVPEDISLIGYANLDYAGFPNINLTTVDQPKMELGRVAAQVLLEQIELKNNFKTKNIVLPVQLIIRKSTRNISGSPVDEPISTDTFHPSVS